MTIKSKSYEECREDFFVNLIKHAENKIKYWKRQTGYRCELADNLSQAGAEIQYCLDALAALEKQIPKKPLNKTMEYNGDYGECPCCGRCVSDFDELTRCKTCGQALDWSDNDKNE